MANITENLKQILSARYGKDVRQSIHDSIEEINSIATGAQSSATAAASTATAKANEALTASRNATTKAEEALASAEQAKMYAENASAVTNVQIAKADVAGIIKGGENHIAEDGTLTLTKHTTDSALANSHAGGIKLIGVQGASEQKQYNGYQLFDASKLAKGTLTSLDISEDGYIITCNGKTSYASCYGDLDIEKFIGKTAYIKADNMSKSSDLQTIYARLRATNTSGNHTYIGISQNSLSNFGIIPEDTTRLTLFLYTQFSNTTFEEDVTAVFEGLIVSIVENPDFEPYVGGIASPNPDYPQEIKSVEVSEIKSGGGRNLFDYDTYMQNNKQITFSVIGGRTLYRNAKLDVTAHWTIYDKDGNSLGTFASFGFSNTKPLTLPETASYIAVIGDKVNDDLYIGYDSDNTYTPYQESVIALPEPVTLRGIGDVKDEIVQQDGVWGVLRRIGKYITDGTETINPSSALTGRWYFSNLRSYIKKYSSCMTNVSVHVQNGTELWQHFIDHNGSFFLNTDYETVDEYRNFLSETSMSIVYELATPVFEPFADQTPFYGLKSYDTVTYISTDSAIEPVIELEYGTSKVGAYTIDALNTAKRSEILYSDLVSAVLALNQE